MSKRIKNNSRSPQISAKGHIEKGCSSEQCIWFSFKYMTSNSRHSLDYFKSGKEREITLASLYSRLNEISKKTWRDWLGYSKKYGLETMSVQQLHFDADSGANLTKDTSLYIFRFDTHLGTGKGRIIGFKSDPCSVFHIIGYDFDFTGYNH